MIHYLETESTVVGAGIARVMTAFHLLEEENKDGLVEHFRVINGTTSHTTAKPSTCHRPIYSDLKKDSAK